ncbi:MAG: hypothetical protein ACLQEQ_06930 [Nitrososphaerales archaeon]
MNGKFTLAFSVEAAVVFTIWTDPLVAATVVALGVLLDALTGKRRR